MGVMSGKRGLVMGVANDKSIAWGIAKALSEAGAELALTYQGDAFGKRVMPLAESLGASLVLDADVTDDGSLDAVFDAIEREWGQMDFLVHAIAFADKADLTGRFSETSRAGFATAMNISCFSFIDTAARAAKLMPDGGAIVTLTYAGSQRIQPFYNVMGVAKAALESATRYLAGDLGENGIRVNAISPGPMRTLAGAAIGGARKVYRHTEANAPLGRNASLEAVGGAAVYLLSDMAADTTGEIIRVDGGFHVMGMPGEENL